MSTWYRIDRSRFKRGHIDKVNVTKETEHTVWIDSLWRGCEGKTDKYAKTSRDYFFIEDEQAAKQRASDMIEQTIADHKDSIDRLKMRLESLDD